MLELNFVLDSTGGKLVSDAGSIDFSGVSTDSRNISKGEIFFALKGENFDGHAYVDEAFTRGAAAAVIEKDDMTRLNGKPIIRDMRISVESILHLLSQEESIEAAIPGRL